MAINKNIQYYKFCAYGFFKNLKFFEPFFILFFLDKELSYLQIGTLYAVKEITVNILEVPTGFIADMLGRRKAMVTSFVSYIAAFLAFYFFNAYAVFFVAIILYSVGDAMRSGTHKAMILEYLKINNQLETKVKYYGNTRSWSQFGSALSSIIAAIIVILSGNYQLVFLVSVIPYIIDLSLILSYPKSLDGKIKRSIYTSVKQMFSETFGLFKESFKYKKIWVSILNLSLYQGFFKSLKDYLQPIVVIAVSSLPIFVFNNDKSRTALIIGFIYFFIYILSSITSRNSDKVLKLLKTNERTLNVTLFIGILASLFSGILVCFQMPILAIIMFSSIFILQNIRKPVGTALISDLVNSNIFATGLSVQSQFDSIFAALFAVIAGAIADYYSVGIALLSLSGLLLLMFFLVQIHSQK